jgi:hypothetical protein
LIFTVYTSSYLLRLAQLFSDVRILTDLLLEIQ